MFLNNDGSPPLRVPCLPHAVHRFDACYEAKSALMSRDEDGSITGSHSSDGEPATPPLMPDYGLGTTEGLATPVALGLGGGDRKQMLVHVVAKQVDDVSPVSHEGAIWIQTRAVALLEATQTHNIRAGEKRMIRSMAPELHLSNAMNIAQVIDQRALVRSVVPQMCAARHSRF
jgi:hypothetical protein